MAFRKAERKQVKLKIGISAPSGAGKTYSALLVAYGICGDWEKIAVIDTENGSAELYSNFGAYSVCPIAPPFTPKKYIEAIHEAEEGGFSVLIIDSLSHAWQGEGGLLDMQDKAAKASKSGNSYTAWREITPEHNRLVDAILQSNLDIIVTTRAKAEYVITDDGNGKKNIKKVGLAPVFREGLEYEMTVFFDMTQDHIAATSKDRTGLFDGQNFMPSIETGKMLNDWRVIGAECKCAVCGKAISIKLYNQSVQKYGTPFCSGECKAKYDAAQESQAAEVETQTTKPAAKKEPKAEKTE